MRKTLTFSPDKYRTAKDVRKAIQQQVDLANSESERHKVAATFGTICQLYRAEHLPTLRHSTKTLNTYMLQNYIEPRWGETPLHEVTAKRVIAWMGELGELAATTKATIRSIMSQCFVLAALNEFIEPNLNPMRLVRIKGTSKREKEITILTPTQFKQLVDALPSPLNLMVLLTGVLGLRVGEVTALHWDDVDWEGQTITIQRNFTRQQVGEVKTDASRAVLPLDEDLIGILAEHRKTTKDSPLLFPSPRTGGYRAASMLLQKGIQRAAEKLKIGRVTWHSLRHSCRSWLDAKGTPVGTMKDLLRHADVSTTMNRYGRALPQVMREGQSAILGDVLPDSMKVTPLEVSTT